MSTDYEGKYFGFEFEADYTQEEIRSEAALAIFQVINGNLEQRFHPCDHGETEGIIGERETELALEYLKSQGAKELFSTFHWNNPEHNEEFMGLIRSYRADLIDPEDNTRYNYTGLCYDEYDNHRDVMCKEKGITLKKYEEK